MGGAQAPDFQEQYAQLSSMYHLDSDAGPSYLNDLFSHFHALFPDGRLTRTEFIRANIAQKGGDESFWNRIFDLVDENSDGVIDFREYLIFLLLSRNRDTTSTLEFVFRLLDGDDSGYLERNEIEVFVEVMLHKFSDAVKTVLHPDSDDESSAEQPSVISTSTSVDKMFQVMDHDHDQRISVDEFCGTCVRMKEFHGLFMSCFDQTQMFFQDRFEASLETQSCRNKADSFRIVRGGKIFKLLLPNEYDFYEKFVMSLGRAHEQRLFYRYFGRTRFKSGKEIVHYLALEDPEKDFRHPSVLTISTATPAEVSVVKVWRNTEQKFLVFQQKEVNSDLINRFIYDGDNWRNRVLKRAIPHLRQIGAFVRRHSEYNFDGCTIYFAYDSAVKGDACVVKICDFDRIQKKGSFEDGILESRGDEIPFNQTIFRLLEELPERFREVMHSNEVIV